MPSVVHEACRKIVNIICGQYRYCVYIVISPAETIRWQQHGLAHWANVWYDRWPVWACWWLRVWLFQLGKSLGLPADLLFFFFLISKNRSEILYFRQGCLLHLFFHQALNKTEYFKIWKWKLYPESCQWAYSSYGTRRARVNKPHPMLACSSSIILGLNF